VIGLQSSEELAVTQLLLLARAGLVQDVPSAPPVEVDARDAVGGGGVGADALGDGAGDQGLGGGVVQADGADPLLSELEGAFEDDLVLGASERGRDHRGATLLDVAPQLRVVVAGLVVVEQVVRDPGTPPASRSREPS
jgi:hypothetical protein